MAATRAVLLDLWNTTAWGEMPPEEERLTTQLGVTEGMLYEAFERTRRYRGTGGPSTTVESLAVVVQACGVELDRDAVRWIAEVHIAWLRRGVHLYDDTLPALRELRGRGMRTAIVSNCDHFTRPAVDALGLEDEVDTVLLSFEVGAMKPDAPIYEEALRRLAVDADQAVFVEDQADYCEGAEALGIRALRIEREGRDPDPERQPVIRDLRALLQLV